MTAVPCFDNDPDWTITLVLDDGESLVLANHHSNLVGLGGPWQTTIDGQRYLQASSAFPKALWAVLEAASLPLGEPIAYTCVGLRPSLLDAAWP